MMKISWFLAAASVLVYSGCGQRTNTSVVPETPSIVSLSTNLIRDGSFERPLVPPSSYVLFNTGQSFNHWKVVGATGNVAVVGGKFTFGGYSFPAGCGKQAVDLTGTSNSATGVAQRFDTVKGTKYTISFKVGNVVAGGSLGTTSTVKVYLNGKHIFSAKNSKGKGVTHEVWEKFQVSFTAASTETTLSLINGDPSSDTANGLDCVSVVAG
jgi:hypothetical protein